MAGDEHQLDEQADRQQELADRDRPDERQLPAEPAEPADPAERDGHSADREHPDRDEDLEHHDGAVHPVGGDRGQADGDRRADRECEPAAGLGASAAAHGRNR